MTILSAASSHTLVATLKWPPSKADVVKNDQHVRSPEHAESELGKVERQILFLTIQSKLLRLVPGFNEKLKDAPDHLAALRKRQSALTFYLSQSKMPSYDLDLCCACYDAAGTCLAYVYPAIAAHHKKIEQAYADPQKHAIKHSGDDRTGMRRQDYNEALTIDLALLSPAVSDIIFVAHSANHSFDTIEGQSSWSLTDATDKTALLSATLRKDKPYRLYAMAKVTRDAESWRIEQLDSYIPLSAQYKDVDKAIFSQIIMQHCIVEHAKA